MKNTTNMAELMKQVEAFEKPQNLDEGFASDAQRRAAFAQGYKAKGKKGKKDEEVLDEAKATLSRFGGDRLKNSIMDLAKQRGLKVKDLGKDKIEISGNQKVVMAITLAVQKKDVKINEGPPNTQATPDVAAMRAAGKANELPKIKAKSKQMVAVAKEEVDIQEDGHTDVASAIRQCKTMVEDAMQITSKLQTMNPEDSLPSWWTNKLAVSSNSMNKLRDYFLVPTTEEVELEEKSEYGPDIRGEISQLQKMLKGLERGKKTPGRGFAKMRIKELIADLEKRQAQDDAVMKLRGEEIELDEKAGDIPDLKNLVGELVKASGMHLAQSKRVQAHVDMMTKANAKGPEGAGGLADLKKIVGELQKASEAHKRQSKSIDAHVKFMDKMEMKEYIEDELDEGMKYTHVAVDKKGLVIGFASDEKDAKDMARRNDGKVVKLKKPMSDKKGDMMVNRPFKEEVELGEGYEKEVLLVLKDAGISGSFRSGRLYVDKQDVKDARSALKDSDKFRSLPRIVGEEVELDEGKMKRMKSYIDDIANAMKKDRMMKAFADKFVKDAQKTLDPRKSLEKVLPDYVPGKDIARLLNMGEEVKLDENASKAFDRIIKDGGIDKKDFQKAKQLYMKKDLTGLRKFIYNLDTAALEAVMDVISRNDSKAFMKMYPRSKGGEYMSSIAYAHRND